MLLILYGHLAGWAPLAALPPIYSKQLGVAFFLFASGYSLSHETRARGHVVFNRLFEMFLFGLALAMFVSMVSVAAGGRPNLSNYLPFAAGANVVFNNFPANPTTWYLGTYIHVVVLWAIFSRRFRISPAVNLAESEINLKWSKFRVGPGNRKQRLNKLIRRRYMSSSLSHLAD